MKLVGQLADNGLEHFAKEHFKIGLHTLPKIWILVLDVEKAQFFRKTSEHLEKIGKSHLHEEDLKGFKELAAFLDQAARQDAFDRLVLIADPKTLGKIRQCLSEAVNQKINATLDKDLTHLNKQQLTEYLDKIIWV